MNYNETLQACNERLQTIYNSINNLPNSQEHTVKITENGSKSIVPDGNYRFSKVNINTNVIPDNSTYDLSGNEFPVISIKELDKGANGQALFSSGYEKLPFCPKRLPQLPKTIEATVHVPTSGDDQYWGSMVAWNDSLSDRDCILWDIREDNLTKKIESRFICAIRDSSNGNREVVIRFVGALEEYRGKQVHIALIIDPDNTNISLYVNGVIFTGEVVYTPSGSGVGSMAGIIDIYNNIKISKLPFMTIGGDWREKIPKGDKTEGVDWWRVWDVNNFRYFRGGIYNVALFSDIRTASEIQQDKTTLPTIEDNILMSYDFTGTASSSVGMSLRPGFSLRPVLTENKLARLIDRTIDSMSVEDFEDVAVIGKGAFSGCTNLGYCEIPHTVFEIESKAFENCSGLEYIMVFASEPPTIYEDTFIGIPENCIIRVYEDCLDLYKQADIWKDLKNPLDIMREPTQ